MKKSRKILNIRNIFSQIPNNIFLFLLSLILSTLFVDFASGLAHWLGDTWGNETWPIFGKTFIKPFREHHQDQRAICRHSFLETNGNNAIITLPFLLFGLYLSLTPSKIHFFISSTILISSILALLTNQIHKWAHAENVNRLVRLLQQGDFILSPENHKVH